MVIINFSHTITQTQRAQIEALAGYSIERIIEIKAQFDHARSFAEQVREMVDVVEMSAEEWQSEGLIVNLPALVPAAALALAELHGRMGYFPAVARLAPVTGSVPPQFEVAEILNLQAARDAARHQR